MRLALALGKTLQWVRDNISANEILAWRAFDEVHPFGDIRADLRAGLIADAIRASNGAEPLGLDKYIIQRNKDEKKPDMKDKTAAQIASMLGLKSEPIGE